MIENNKINLALREFSIGNKEKAYKKLKKIFNKNKDNHQLRFNLAVIEQTLNLNTEAKNNYKFLIDNGLNFKAAVNLYLLYIKEDNFTDALLIINKIIKNYNYLENIIKDKAFVLYKLKKYDSSIKLCEDNLAIKEDTDFMNILGLNYFSKENFEKSEQVLKKALLIEKNNPVLLSSLGWIYHERRESKKAEKYLIKAYNLKRNSYEIVNNLAGFYREESSYIKAIDLYTEALKINPHSPSLINNLAKAYFDIGEIDKAKDYCFRALKLNKNDGNIQKIISLIYFREQNYKEAWAYFDGRLNLSDFVEKNSSIISIRKKLFTGPKINRSLKILILREQGIGDEILYGTMYRDLFNSFQNITIECDKRLKTIFQNSFPENHNSFVDLGSISENEKIFKNYDYAIYAGSLGRFFRSNINDFNDGNYLRPDEIYIKKTRKLIDTKNKRLNIGLSWKSFKNRYSDEKSLRLQDFSNILNFENCNFYNLQYGDVNKEIKAYNEKNKRKIKTLEGLDLYNDFNSLAGVLKNLDLFISVSNSTAHLAGSLGVKTFLIKPVNHATFHYWNQSDDKTPWYKSIKLIERKDILEIKNLINNFI